MFRRAGCNCWRRSRALAIAFLVGSVCAHTLIAQDMLINGGAVATPYPPMNVDANPYEAPAGQPQVQMAPPSNAWIAPPASNPPIFGAAPCEAEPAWGPPVVG